MNDLDNDHEYINLGGFPPIFYISTELKKKREFSKKIDDDAKKILSINKLNILNIKNILSKK